MILEFGRSKWVAASLHLKLGSAKWYLRGRYSKQCTTEEAEVPGADTVRAATSLASCSTTSAQSTASRRLDFCNSPWHDELSALFGRCVKPCWPRSRRCGRIPDSTCPASLAPKETYLHIRCPIVLEIRLPGLIVDVALRAVP
jgi:hypothetical protein